MGVLFPESKEDSCTCRIKAMNRRKNAAAFLVIAATRQT
jgi:hypothetical protein